MKLGQLSQLKRENESEKSKYNIRDVPLYQISSFFLSLWVTDTSTVELEPATTNCSTMDNGLPHMWVLIISLSFITISYRVIRKE